MKLDEIALKYGTDKSSIGHNYTKLYEKYFEELRNKPINFLELGWGGYEDPNAGGESARMWREYFTKARITVLDIHPKNNKIDGVKFEQGRQEDKGKAFATFHRNGEFDVIIDDASHISSLTIQSFKNYFPALKGGGLYVIEDLHSSYDPSYYGDADAAKDPEDRTVFTAMMFLKQLCDEVNSEFIGKDYVYGYDIEFIHFYKDICFIKKK